MRKQQKSILVLAIIMAFIAMGFFLPKLIRGGELKPTATPGSPMKTLDEIPPTWSQTLPASERFVLVLNDEAVLDKETGLVWAKDANLADGGKTWEEAVQYCRDLNIGNRKGWRLPTVEELASLIDPSQSNPALPSGNPFKDVKVDFYCSCTTSVIHKDSVWILAMYTGTISVDSKIRRYCVWPVRGGSGPILLPHTITQ